MLFKEIATNHFKKRRFFKFLLSATFISGLLILNSSSSESYTLHTNRKVSSPITYLMHGNFDSLTLSGFNNMLYNWNAQAGKSLVNVSLYSRHYDSVENNYDDISKVYRKAVPASLAYVRTRTNYYGYVVESDIVVNISYPYANGAVYGAHDIQSVLLHEAGHTIGVNHSQYSSAVMYPYSYTNSLVRSLTSDDRAAVNALYK